MRFIVPPGLSPLICKIPTPLPHINPPFYISTLPVQYISGVAQRSEHKCVRGPTTSVASKSHPLCRHFENSQKAHQRLRLRPFPLRPRRANCIAASLSVGNIIRSPACVRGSTHKPTDTPVEMAIPSNADSLTEMSSAPSNARPAPHEPAHSLEDYPPSVLIRFQTSAYLRLYTAAEPWYSTSNGTCTTPTKNPTGLIG